MSELKDIKKGMVLKGSFWPEAVRVLSVDDFGFTLQIDAVGRDTRTSYEGTMIDKSQLERLEIIAGHQGLDFTGNSLAFHLAIESRRIRLAYEYDPYFAVSISQIDPLPHQLEAVYSYLLRQPVIRFLLADDPGAGKTIMAGLLLKELRYRGIADRILILVPPLIKRQWQEELKEKFSEDFTIIDGAMKNNLTGKNCWHEYDRCITSLYWSAMDVPLDALKEVEWDLVIVDEAHKMAAYSYGKKRVKIDKKKLYRLGEELSQRTKHMVLLTATPHKGDSENFRLLLELLDKDLFSDHQILEKAVRSKENPIFLRRLKEEMVKFDGNKLFPERTPKTVYVKLSDAEKNLYEAVTSYVSDHFNRAIQQGKRSVGFVMMLLQRRLASSVRAIRLSLERRKKKLSELLEEVKRYKSIRKELLFDEDKLTSEGIDIDNFDDMEEMQRWGVEEELLERLSMSDSEEELETEIELLADLAGQAFEVETGGMETKLLELMDTVMKKEGIIERKEKLLIFTEAKDTLNYLVENLTRQGFKVVTIDGSKSLDQRREAQELFKQDKTCQIMIATEAGGESINLQFCNQMVNYDIPWNPNRLEQRMGRIHRIGQKNEVFIFNMVAKDTREGDVLGKLLEKIERMKKDLGSDRVFDILGDLLDDSNIKLSELIMDCISNRRKLTDVIKSIDKAVSEEHQKTIEEAKELGLAKRYVNLPDIKNEENHSRAQRLMPEYIERYFTDAYSFISDGKEIQKRADGRFRLEKVSHKLRREDDRTFRRRFGEVKSSYPAFTFRKEDLDKDDPSKVHLFSPGHSLFESVLEETLKETIPHLEKGAIFQDPESEEPYLLWFVEGTVRDGLGREISRRIFAIKEKSNGHMQAAGAFILHDLKPAGYNDYSIKELSQKTAKNKEIKGFFFKNISSSYLEEIKKERLHELEIKEKYLNESFKVLINKSTEKLMQYEERAFSGEDMLLAISEEKKRLANIKIRKKERLNEVEKEKEIYPVAPEIIGLTAVFPMSIKDPQLKDTMHRDDEVELIAMEYAMEYERKEGRIPEDVSSQNLGFDIRSVSPDGEDIRYIEVKGRASDGAIALTTNEWVKADRLRHLYWLYIVNKCKISPELHIIQDPFNNMDVREERTVVRYLADAGDWKKAVKLTV